MQKEFISPFSSAYWKQAAAEYASLRSLCIAALMVALHVVLSFVKIRVGENLNIQVTYLAVALSVVICGPLVGISCGIVTDLVEFLMDPSWGFFPGYTLSCVMGFLIFGLFFYRREITVLRIFLARLCVNLFINVGLGCLWSSMMMGKGYLYYAATSIVKNAIMLPIETVILFLLLRTLLPVLNQLKLIPPQKTIRFLKGNNK